MFFYVLLIILYGVSTQFVHNAVLITVLSPVALTFGTLIGGNPVTITFIGIVILATALATPGASSRSGLVYANTEWIAPKWAYYLGVMSVILVMIAYAVIGVPLANVMFPV
jgi:di/tricarboxylate transporter